MKDRSSDYLGTYPSTIYVTINRYGNATTTDGYVLENRPGGITIIGKELPGGQVADLELADLPYLLTHYDDVPYELGSGHRASGSSP